MKEFFSFFVFALLACDLYAADFYVALSSVRSRCAGISDALSYIKRMAGINTAITGVGTAAATGATIVGIAKVSVDKDLHEILKQVDNAENMTINPSHDAVMSVYDKNIEKYGSIENAQKTLSQKSKSLGHWRTGLLAGGTATNVAGAIIASNNKIDNDLQTRIEDCIKSVDELKNAVGQARLDGVDTNAANNIINACGQWKYADTSVVNTRAKGAMVSSIVGASTGAVGTITSAVANTDATRNGDVQKEKNLNTAANVLAGGTAVASGVATVFNATQIAAVKKIVKIADDCEDALK